MCPGNNESASKHGSGRTRKGSKWPRTALIEAAAARPKGTSFSAQYGGLKSRRGPRRPRWLWGHSILVVAYHVLQRRTPYEDLGPDYLLVRHSTEGYKRRLVRQLERLGHNVTLDPLTKIA